VDRIIYPQEVNMAHIHVDRNNGVEYHTLVESTRINGEKVDVPVLYLGRLLDKEKGAYRNRERGIFTYKVEDGTISVIESPRKEKLILDFGDSYILNEVLTATGFKEVLASVFPSKADTVLAMLFYRVLCGGASRYALTFWEGSYSRILFPDADVESQRISEFYQWIGDEYYHREFFKAYIKHIRINIGTGILVDSTGLPNDIQIPITAVNNHNGVISNEARLVLVVDRKSGLPLYFRYVAGNIVDVSTLKSTLLELKSSGIDVDYAVVDAGYYSEKNIKELQAENISFITRMKPNLKKFKQLVASDSYDIGTSKYLVKYQNRFLHIKKVEMTLFDRTGYAYICQDDDLKHILEKEYYKDIYEEDVLPDNIDESVNELGIFILISSEDITTRELLPLYYTRETVEQVFDIGKNNVDLIPLRIHTEERFRGHLLMSFIASYVYILVNNYFIHTDSCAIGVFRTMKNQKCKIYDDVIIPQEPTKAMNQIYETLNIEAKDKISR
jgi:hypothetical protein